MDAIQVRGLKRSYQAETGIVRRKIKQIVAVDGIDFSVPRGELFGLLGPNGAGKTTTVKVLTTLLTPTGGQASVLGYDTVLQAQHVRRRIGFVLGGERGLYWRLSGKDNLIYFANLYHLSPEEQKRRIPQLFELVGLSGREDEKVQGYSRGMKQRLHIARALLHDPPVLFLDEPTMGLDPVGAREIRQLIQQLQAAAKTILLTTHYMHEADALCQRIGVINEGRLLALDTPKGLKRRVLNLSVIEFEIFGMPPELVDCVRALKDVSMVSVENREQKQVLRIQSADATAMAGSIVRLLQGMGLEASNIMVREPTLEDAYIQLVGYKK